MLRDTVRVQSQEYEPDVRSFSLRREENNELTDPAQPTISKHEDVGNAQPKHHIPQLNFPTQNS